MWKIHKTIPSPPIFHGIFHYQQYKPSKNGGFPISGTFFFVAYPGAFASTEAPGASAAGAARPGAGPGAPRGLAHADGDQPSGAPGGSARGAAREGHGGVPKGPVWDPRDPWKLTISGHLMMIKGFKRLESHRKASESHRKMMEHDDIPSGNP